MHNRVVTSRIRHVQTGFSGVVARTAMSIETAPHLAFGMRAVLS
jgi:hypothetical protein